MRNCHEPRVYLTSARRTGVAVERGGQDAGVRAGGNFERPDHRTAGKVNSRLFLPRTARARRMARTSVLPRQNLAAGGIHFRREISKTGVPGRREPAGAAAKMLEFELAATLRDQIIELRGK